MTRVDFYISKDQTANACQLIAARLTEKAVKQGLRVFIHSASQHEANTMDDLLWSAKPASFLPHSLADVEANDSVVIGWGQEPVGHDEVLINLTANAPPLLLTIQTCGGGCDSGSRSHRCTQIRVALLQRSRVSSRKI